MKKVLYIILACAGLFLFDNRAQAAYDCSYSFDNGTNGEVYNVHFINSASGYTYTCAVQGTNKTVSNAINKKITCGSLIFSIDEYTQNLLKSGSVKNNACGVIDFDLVSREKSGGKTYDHFALSLFGVGDSQNNSGTTTDSPWSCTYSADIDGVSTPIFFKSEGGKTTLSCGTDVNNLKWSWNHCNNKTFILSDAVKTQVNAMSDSCDLKGKEFKLTGNVLDLVTNPQETANTQGNTYAKIVCGDVKVPMVLAKIVRTVVFIIQVATPVIIIVFGSMDLFKAVIAQKDDDIRKGREIFVKRLITGALVFLTFFIVEMVVSIVAPDDAQNSWNCVDCFINGNCDNLGSK